MSVWVCAVWAWNTEIYSGAWPSPSSGTSELWGIHVEVCLRFLQPGEQLLMVPCPCPATVIQFLCHSAGSNVCLYLLVLDFSLISLGNLTWERERTGAASARRQGLAHTAWELIIFVLFANEAPVQVPSFQGLDKEFLCMLVCSKYYFWLIVIPATVYWGSFWAGGQENLP